MMSDLYIFPLSDISTKKDFEDDEILRGFYQIERKAFKWLVE